MMSSRGRREVASPTASEEGAPSLRISILASCQGGSQLHHRHHQLRRATCEKTGRGEREGGSERERERERER
jgi:hypothetical protein